MTETILKEIEDKIHNNFFRNKSELISYINAVRNSNDVDIELFNSKIGNLLSLYDTIVNDEELPLDMSNYKDVKLGDNNYVVSNKDSVVLKNDGNIGELVQEFRSVENDIIITKKDGNVDDDKVFDHMEKYKKEKSSFVPLTDLNVSIIGKEILHKIRFFISNANINPYDYKVDISNGIFLNVSTNELMEVRKNENTGKYEIYKGSEAVHNNETNVDDNGNEVVISEDMASLSDEELVNYEQRKKINKPKKRILRLKPVKGKDAAFINYNLLLVVIFTSSIMIASLLLLLK